MIYKIGKFLIYWFYIHVFNRFICKGKDNLVQDGPLVVFSNHYSDLDVFIIQGLYKQHVTFMAKKQLFDAPIVKWFAKQYGAICVDREKTDIKAVKASLEVLKSNKILCIFPEGTRNRKNEKISAKGGMILLANKTGATLQPIRIKYKRKLNLFNRIEVFIDKPVNHEQLSEYLRNNDNDYDKVSGIFLENVYSLNHENINN